MRLKGLTGRAAMGCLVAAVAIFLALAAAGDLRAGAAAAIGLILGSANGLIADRALGAGISPRASSIPRLALLTSLAAGAGFLIGTDVAWVLILGVAAAQLVLVGVATRFVLSR